MNFNQMAYELARERQGTALVAKLDTDRAQRTAGGFNIRGIPTSIVFKGGKEVGTRLMGDIKRSELKQAVEAMLAL